ncbi:hypothetical protein Ddye_001528 [Dipteronia dyeriana]|uniref:RNase H type-1 domain-containing protein n=1 Tax=Dipteronia dyeriana TaxID=168575 RepID=A0AAD9XNN6_9ROSI|nr:hypothetical protein Ddye_001528 [Dipteronia dyeriana]
MVQLLSSRSEQVPWRIRQTWQHCIYQISKMEFQVSHIFREENQVADALSKHALGLEVDSWWKNSPSFCSLLVDNDFMDLVVVEEQVVPCHISEECKEYKCKQGTPHCTENQCNCNFRPS